MAINLSHYWLTCNKDNVWDFFSLFLGPDLCGGNERLSSVKWGSKPRFHHFPPRCPVLIASVCQEDRVSMQWPPEKPRRIIYFPSSAESSPSQMIRCYCFLLNCFIIYLFIFCFVPYFWCLPNFLFNRSDLLWHWHQNILPKNDLFWVLVF